MVTAYRSKQRNTLILTMRRTWPASRARREAVCLLSLVGVDTSLTLDHSGSMSSSESLARRQWRHHTRLLTVTLVTSTAIVVGTAGLSAQAQAQGARQVRPDLSSKHHKPQTKHQKSKTQQSGNHPCLEGNWNVTSLTLSTTGLTFTGGAGTTVNIMSNGNALGNFTPGTPLTGSEGSAKFNGTITDHYGFSPKTTSHSGTFPVTPVTNMATITVGGITKPVTSSDEQGSYVCSGKDLTLTFTSASSTLRYQMTPAS
jgi:hypothetical protein